MATPTWEDFATAVGNMHQKFCHGRTCSSGDMLADTNRYAHHYALLLYRGQISECYVTSST